MHHLNRPVAVAVALAVWLALAPARADEDVTPEAQARAKVHFQRGMAAFELGNFQEALDEYERAYGLAPLPGFLFNIGQCHRNLGNLRKAVFSFRHYLRKKPEARNRDAVMTLIRDLEAKIEAKAEADRQAKARVPVFVVPEKDPPPVRRRRPVPVYKRGWFWPVLVTSLVLAGGGAATGIYFGTRSAGPDLPEAKFQIDFSRR